MALSSSSGSSRGPAGGNATPTSPRTPATPAATTYPPAQGRARGQSGRNGAGNPRSGQQPSGQRRNPEAAPKGDTLELIDHAPIGALQAGHDAHLDPLIRGTRPIGGTTGTGATIGNVQHGDATVRATPYNVSLTGHDAQGREGSLTVDRQSALAGGSIPMGDGEKVTFSGGPIANLAYGSATYHDGQGNGVGGFLMATTQGTPGVGLTFTHVGELASVAATPSVLADKTLEATVQKVVVSPATESAASKTVATVKQSSSKMALFNVPVSMGVGPLSFAVRAYGDAKESKSYTYKTSVAEASKEAPRTGIVRKRVAGLFGNKNVRQAPKLTELSKYAPGDENKLEVGHSLVLSGGTSLMGAQLVGGVVTTTKTSATVALTEAKATGESARAKVTLSKDTTRGKIFAADMPMLVAARVGQNTVVQRSVGYEFAATDEAGVSRAVARNKTRLSTQGHFATNNMFEVGDLDTVEDGVRKLESMQQQNPAINKLQLAVTRGGFDWRISVFGLAASLGGERFGLAVGQQRNRQVSYRTVTDKLSFTADGTLQRTTRELPYIGGFSRQYQFLQVASLPTDAESADDGKVTRAAVVQLAVNHTHANHRRTLRSVTSMMERTVPGLLMELPEPQLDAKASIPIPMDFNVSLSAVVTPTVVQKLATQSDIFQELGPVPATDALFAEDGTFFGRALKVLERKMNGSSREDAESAILTLHDADAHVAVSASTNLFANVEREVAQLHMKAEAIVRVHQKNSPPVLRRKLLKQAAQQVTVLRRAHSVLYEPALQLLEPEKRSAHKTTLRTSRKNLEAIFHPDIEAQRAGFLSTSPRTKSYLEELSSEKGLLSPPLPTVELNPFEGAIPIKAR